MPKPGEWVKVVWNDTFPPLNLWNYPNKGIMDREYIEAPNVGIKSTFTVNDIQYGGDHYKNKAIQPWDYISSNNMGFLEGCIIKYVSRYQDKNGIEDLHKARHFLEKLIEVRTGT
jgi:hypothetical protein